MRCGSSPVRKLLPLFTVVCLLSVETGHAQFRTLPANAKRTTVGEPQVLPYVELGGKVVRLAPGGVIYDQNNRTIVHGALPAHADAVFTTDMNGDVARIYILTPQEQAQFNQRK
jgi:hypothetical protein